MRHHTVALSLVVSLASLTVPAIAQQGGGMMGGRRDTATTAIMRDVHEMLANHDKLRRTVTNLPDGIRTLTESDDPAMAAILKSHVAKTGVFVSQGLDPDLPMSTPSLHGVLRNGSRITRTSQPTEKGVLVIETSADSATVALLQQHAAEVTDMVQRGMVAAHEAMMKQGGMASGMTKGNMSHNPSDSAFSALQERGKVAMGVDQYTSTHHFEAMADGGRIELQRDVDDAAGVAQIGSHLREIEKAFTSGDFSTPEFVHMQTVPGATVMAAKRALITYAYRDLPRGGELRITTNDKDALAAIHQFLAFQRTDHRAH